MIQARSCNQPSGALAVYDFVSQLPEVLHMVTWVKSPWGIPAGDRDVDLILYRAYTISNTGLPVEPRIDYPVADKELISTLRDEATEYWRKNRGSEAIRNRTILHDGGVRSRYR